MPETGSIVHGSCNGTATRKARSMNALKIASYLLALALAALGIWLSNQNKPTDLAVGSAPPAIEIPYDEQRGPAQAR